MTPTCAACYQLVSRADCHRNRYRELICHACQARGVRFTWRNRMHHHGRMLMIGVWITLGLTALGLLIAWALHVLFLVPVAWLSG